MKLKKIQNKLATTFNKKEQQKDGKDNDELQIKWKKRTWKTFEKSVR